jgi:phosphoglycerate dehydrogenase-like enzyme
VVRRPPSGRTPGRDPLRSARNTVLTPHIGFVARRSYERIYGDAVEDITAWLDGSPVRELTP